MAGDINFHYDRPLRPLGVYEDPATARIRALEERIRVLEVALEHATKTANARLVAWLEDAE